LRERFKVLLDLAEGIAYFHSQTILHRDLKPCNIGFDHDGVLKLFDFDVSRLVPTRKYFGSHDVPDRLVT
jgi:serine/threonine protein kinase